MESISRESIRQIFGYSCWGDTRIGLLIWEFHRGGGTSLTSAREKTVPKTDDLPSGHVAKDGFVRFLSYLKNYLNFHFSTAKFIVQNM